MHLPRESIGFLRSVYSFSFERYSHSPDGLAHDAIDASARDRGLRTILAEQERDDYSSFSAGGREGDEVPRE